jgi:hypothetical protein
MYSCKVNPTITVTINVNVRVIIKHVASLNNIENNFIPITNVKFPSSRVFLNAFNMLDL